MIKWNLYDQEFKKGFLSSLDTTKFIQIKLNQKKKKKKRRLTFVGPDFTCKAMWKRTQQLPTLLGQQCWELLRPFARG